MGSSNTEYIGVRYCKRSRSNRAFYKVKPRVSGGGVGYSAGLPTKYVSSAGYVYSTYPPKAK